jgi:hypothetical protein
MNRFINSGRAFMLPCILMLAVGAVQAQTETGKKTDALELKLSAQVTTLCLGSSIGLEMELKNVGQETLKIDKYDLWRSYLYSKSKYSADSSGRAGGESSVCDECRGDFVVLYPGETFWTSHKFSLGGEFFREAVRYNIGVKINSARSNRVIFELVDCGKKLD